MVALVLSYFSKLNLRLRNETSKPPVSNSTGLPLRNTAETPLPYCINSRLDQFSSAAYDPDILNRTVFPDQRFHHHWSLDPLQRACSGYLGTTRVSRYPLVALEVYLMPPANVFIGKSFGGCCFRWRCAKHNFSAGLRLSQTAIRGGASTFTSCGRIGCR